MSKIDDANFTPSLVPTEKVGGLFPYWCQHVLPAVYDDSLSYYQLLTKVVAYLNDVIKQVDATTENMDTLLATYEKLQQYVNDYFNSLDVQEEIDNKLDEMVADGTLAVAIAPTIATEVANWLKDNITPTTPPVDDTFTIKGAAADSLAVGRRAILFREELRSGALSDNLLPGWYYIDTNANIIDRPKTAANIAFLVNYHQSTATLQIYYELFNKCFWRFVSGTNAGPWHNNVDDTLSMRDVAADAYTVGARSFMSQKIGSATKLSDVRTTGWYIFGSETIPSLTDLPRGCDNLSILKVYNNGEHAYQFLNTAYGKTWERDILLNTNTIGTWRSTIYSGNRYRMVNGDDANNYNMPGSYYRSGETVSNLPTNDEGNLIVLTSMNTYYQMYITLDGRLWIRSSGRQWRMFSNPYVSFTDRISSFVAKMNEKAKAMGMSNSVFTTPSGETNDNKTTVEDMLKCTMYANTYGMVKLACGADNYTINISGNSTPITRVTNYNNLMPNFTPIWGKTGSWNDSTSPVGTGFRTLTCVCKHNESGRIFAGVVMLANNDAARFTAMSELMEATYEIAVNGSSDKTVNSAMCAISCEVFGDSPLITKYLYEKNITQVSSPASMTKVLALITALDSCRDLNAVVTVPSAAYRGSVNLKANDTISLFDCMVDTMMVSENTGAYTIANYVGERLWMYANSITPVN